jgi:hypothetical protein
MHCGLYSFGDCTAGSEAGNARITAAIFSRG